MTDNNHNGDYDEYDDIDEDYDNNNIVMFAYRNWQSYFMLLCSLLCNGSDISSVASEATETLLLFERLSNCLLFEKYAGLA